MLFAPGHTLLFSADIRPRWDGWAEVNSSSSSSLSYPAHCKNWPVGLLFMCATLKSDCLPLETGPWEATKSNSSTQIVQKFRPFCASESHSSGQFPVPVKSTCQVSSSGLVFLLQELVMFQALYIHLESTGKREIIDCCRENEEPFTQPLPSENDILSTIVLLSSKHDILAPFSCLTHSSNRRQYKF